MAKTFGATAAVLVSLAALSFCGCDDSGKAKKIKLRAAADSGKSEAGPGERKGAPLRLSVAAMLSPKSSFVTYGELARYLGKRLDTPIEVAFTKRYAETNEALRNSGTDIAFVCTGAFIAAKEVFPLEVLAVPVVNGGTVYNSVILAGKNSPARGLADLKGKVFAFTDEFSLTGRLYVQARLAESKQTLGFFSGTILTGSHDNSIKAVAEGFADAACVDELIYRALLQRGDFYARQLKVIETSPPFGIPPVVVRHGLNRDIVNRARAALLSMHRDKEGLRILKAISLERFALPAPGLYSYAEKVYKMVNEGGKERKAVGGNP